MIIVLLKAKRKATIDMVQESVAKRRSNLDNAIEHEEEIIEYEEESEQESESECEIEG